jgi:hypothetical protein
MKKSFKKKKKKTLLKPYKSYKPSKALIKDLETLLECVPAGRLCRSLRKMFMLYIFYEKDGLPVRLEETIIDLYFLFEFLDAAEDELAKSGDRCWS